MSKNQKLQTNSKQLIINADDFGMSHGTNKAIIQMLEEGYVTSATAMVPCPWFKEVASYCQSNPNVNVGIHLTFTSEWKHYKWGPITCDKDVSTLTTEEGFFPRSSADIERNSNPKHLEIEIRNQIELAISMGLKPTHLDNHMGSLYGLSYGKDFLQVVFDICEEYKLPFRLPRYLNKYMEASLPKDISIMLKERIKSAEERGITILDHLIDNSVNIRDVKSYDEAKDNVIKMLKNIEPGVSEIYIHPSFATDELKGITTNWNRRQLEYDLFRDAEVINTIEEEGIKLISWRELGESLK